MTETRRGSWYLCKLASRYMDIKKGWKTNTNV